MRSNHPEEFLEKGILKIYSKFTGEQIALYSNRTSAWVFSCKFAAYFQNTFLKNTSGWLILNNCRVLLFSKFIQTQRRYPTFLEKIIIPARKLQVISSQNFSCELNSSRNYPLENISNLSLQI